MADEKIYSTRQMIDLISVNKKMKFKTVNQSNQLLAYIDSKYRTLNVINKKTDAKYEGDTIRDMEWVEI